MVFLTGCRNQQMTTFKAGVVRGGHDSQQLKSVMARNVFNLGSIPGCLLISSAGRYSRFAAVGMEEVGGVKGSKRMVFLKILVNESVEEAVNVVGYRIEIVREDVSVFPPN